MLTIRREAEIFKQDGGWFNARWHFSFDRYHDPQQMGVGPLRVFNDDRIVAGAEWPMHPHRDIESLTYVVEGHFEHADSLGNDGRLEPGAAQAMSFSHRGAMHSERNASQTEPLRFLQFWILPAAESAESGIQQRQHTADDRTDRWLQIMGPAGEEGLDLRQDARIRVARLTAGHRLTHAWGSGRGGYLYVIDGDASLDGQKVAAGDAAKIRGPHEIVIQATADTELINVDVPLEYEPVGVWAGRP
jgi:redox-sensitive bicupin YhaK (pirin superfamily)